MQKLIGLEAGSLKRGQSIASGAGPVLSNLNAVFISKLGPRIVNQAKIMGNMRSEECHIKDTLNSVQNSALLLKSF